MKICIIGTGYVGLVSGVCFAEMGNDVICVDNIQVKIDKLNNNIIPIYEPGLEELVKNNRTEGRLKFTIDIKTAIENSLLIFIAVGTPTENDGAANLKYVFDVGKCIGTYMNDYKIIINKSTVPIGTAEKVRLLVSKELSERKSSLEFDMVSNPEFLKEGAAIEDFMRPDRVVIGTDNAHSAEVMKELYSPFVKNGHPILLMDIKSAEITKYASNCMLAMRISFMNEIANICEAKGADVTKVRLGLGTDNRIGMPFLYAGLGYGGSCFPKDIRALIKTFSESNMESDLLRAIENTNNKQRDIFINKILQHFNNKIQGLTLAVWGLAFKPNTDDMRDAPSVTIIERLILNGAKINAFDPQAVKQAKEIFGEKNRSITYYTNQYDALMNADALILVTEWNSFKRPDFDRMFKSMKNKIIFDGRNQYDPLEIQNYGCKYISIGR